MFVHVLADTPARRSDVEALLASTHDVTSELLDSVNKRRSECHALVVKVDLRDPETIVALRATLNSMANVPKRIFLLDHPTRLNISQAYALGATLILTGTTSQKRLLSVLSDDASRSGTSDDEPAAAQMGATAIASIFAAVTAGKPIDVWGTLQAGEKIMDHVAENGLSDWLVTVRRHHEGTYQHCLLVTGVTIDFGLSLGLARADLQRLSSAAMFHDIGKATIPLAVLDKPGRLDAQERAIIETHPVAGYDALKDENDISAEVLDAVRHHHEYLDGSGYPDALCDKSISDIVRILTISDIFSALIEDRRYKAPMSREDAYGVLCSMQGKLEKPLVASFREVALNR
jgi:putative nucleotidyltransferase with HDIG domain